MFCPSSSLANMPNIAITDKIYLKIHDIKKKSQQIYADQNQTETHAVIRAEGTSLLGMMSRRRQRPPGVCIPEKAEPVPL